MLLTVLEILFVWSKEVFYLNQNKQTKRKDKKEWSKETLLWLTVRGKIYHGPEGVTPGTWVSLPDFIWKQREMNTQLFSFFYSFWELTPGMVPPSFVELFSRSTKLCFYGDSKSSLIDSEEEPSQSSQISSVSFVFSSLLFSQCSNPPNLSLSPDILSM